MITAVDSNMLLGVLAAEPVDGQASRAVLGASQRTDRQVVWAIVQAEFSRQFP